MELQAAKFILSNKKNKILLDNNNFQYLIYKLCHLPVSDVPLGWDKVVEPYFNKHFDLENYENENLHNFLHYVENTFIGKPLTSGGGRRPPRFSISMWNIHERILDEKPDCNNAVKS